MAMAYHGHAIPSPVMESPNAKKTRERRREVLFVTLLPVIILCLPSVYKESLLSVFVPHGCVGETGRMRGDTNVGTMLATYGWLARQIDHQTGLCSRLESISGHLNIQYC